ncbi:MAG: hypothetical protein ACXWPM_01095 [Bdellovibrionota bacterium]
MNYCAGCGKKIDGIHVIERDGLRYHPKCAPEKAEGNTTASEFHNLPQELQPRFRNPDTTQIYEDLQALISMLNDPPIVTVPRAP